MTEVYCSRMNIEERGILFKDECRGQRYICSRLNIEEKGMLFKDEYRGQRYIVQG